MALDRIAIVGTGFVADLYMRSLETFPNVEVVGAYDINQTRLKAFGAYWNVPLAESLDQLLHGCPVPPNLILNLTNPEAHFEVTRICLLAGKHVYSEKPIATNMDDALALGALATSSGLMLSSAPCSVLSEVAQTLWLAVRRNEIGKVRLVYAELDDDFMPLQPYRKWQSLSGAPWPYKDEFQVGCTLEHAGYYLTWLMAMFGSVEKVIAASANLVGDELDSSIDLAPDFSCATLFFKSGVAARLTCSIIAPRNHGIRIVGDTGVLHVDDGWNNSAGVYLQRRHVFRRRLINSPFRKRIKIKGATHQKVERWGAAAMNFALGPAEMLEALRESRPCRLSTELALHLNEVTLAIQNANGSQVMRTTCPNVEPMPYARG